MKKNIRLLLPTLLGIMLSACSSIPSPSEKYAKYSADQIYQIAEVKLAQAKYRDAIEAYEGLDSLYPFNSHAEQAQLDMIYAYIKNNDMPSAVAAADRYIHLYPRSPHIDYAYYLKGIADFNQDRGFFQRYLPVDQAVRDPGTMTQAYDDFKTLIKLYPQSRYAADAKQRLVYLRNTFAERQIEIARFYMQKQAYVAVVNRSNYVLEQYSDTPAAREALNLMEQAYQKLGLKTQAAQTQEIIAANK